MNSSNLNEIDINNSNVNHEEIKKDQIIDRENLSSSDLSLIVPDVIAKDNQQNQHNQLQESIIESSTTISTPKIWVDRVNALTPFELSLQPRKLLPINTSDGNKEIVIVDRNKDFFTDEIMCPICLGVLENAWLVMACLHRYLYNLFYYYYY
jgi:hypothetical protein